MNPMEMSLTQLNCSLRQGSVTNDQALAWEEDYNENLQNSAVCCHYAASDGRIRLYLVDPAD